MNYSDWKRTLLAKSALIAGAFLAGMIVEAVVGYSPYGVVLVAFFVCLLSFGSLVLLDSWLERWWEHQQNRRGVDWAEF